MIAWFTLWLGIAANPAGVTFAQSKLAVPGRVVAVYAADVGGDGQNEILVFWRQGYPFESIGRLSVYSFSGGTFGPSPAQVLVLPKTTVAFDVGDADGDLRADVLLLSHDGIWSLNGKADGQLSADSRQLIQVMTVTAFPHDDDVPPMNLLFQLDGRERLGILVPTIPIGPISLFERRAGKEWFLRQVLRVPTRIRISTAAEDFRAIRDFGAEVELSYPRVVLNDQNGDELPDLFFFRQDSVGVFRQRSDGAFPSEPDIWSTFGLLRPKERVKPSVVVRGEVGDVNGDHRGDLCFNKTVGGIANMRSEVQLFLANPDGTYQQTPAFVRKFRGYGASAHLADVDGDKRRDLVFPRVEMGLTELVRMMLVGRIEVNFEIHLARNGLWKSSPDLVIPSPFGINYRSAQELTGNLPIFGEDFSGDGVPDVVVGIAGGGTGKNPDRLEIRSGKREGNFAGAIWEMNLLGTRHVIPFRVGRNELPGLIIYFTFVEEKQGDVWVFANTKTGF